jgi:hypothetical protein
MRIAQIDEDGFAIALHTPPPGIVAVSALDTVDAEGRRLRIVDGAEAWVWDHRGQVCHIGEPARQISIVPRHHDLIGKSWAELAGLGYHQYPSPETPAERAEREKAAAAAEAERKAARIASKLQIRLAANEMGLRDAIEARMADPATPQDIRDFWNFASEFRRDHPLWPGLILLLGKTPADLDALYDLAEIK